ncbi:unnamed protein product [Rotaria sp. Silwood2]|nr:unnamed protein product [Rotaria sp. Silwood2]CAF4586859.1 unnamed protein product [Rotaria sp. Silwood2]
MIAFSSAKMHFFTNVPNLTELESSTQSSHTLIIPMTLSLVNTLEWSTIILNRWFVPIMFLIGVLGNIFNLMVFTRKNFFRKSCFLYLLAASINNIVMFLIGLSTRIMDDGFQITIFRSDSDVYCKFRIYLVYTLFAISNWFLVFASFDRFYSTSQSALKRQRFCCNRMAFKLICLTVIGCLLTHIHIIIYYKYLYYLNVYNKPTLTCASDNGIYTMFFSFFMLIFYSLLPPILMLLIGLLTLNNIRKSHQQINPNRTQTLTRRDAHQLIKTLSIQIALLIITTIPHSSYWIYMAFASGQYSMKTNLTLEYEKFILNIVRLILYINYGSIFYIQISISKTFRNEFIKIINKMKRHFRNLY